jgi:hypothetical protein
MRVILDSNILFSALISPHGPPHRIFTAWQDGRFDLITCAAQLEEIRVASRYPKLRAILQPHRVGALVNALRGAALPDPPAGDVAVNDPHDWWLLPLAETARADWIVTGDRRAGLLTLRRHGGTRIVTAATFCTRALR